MEILDMIRVNLTSASAGTLTLGAKIQGFNSTADAWSGAVDQTVYTWAIEANFDSNGVATARESGYGTYTASGNTITRNTVSSTLSSNAQITITGTAQVIICINVHLWAAPTFDTSATTPLLIGGTGASSSLTLESTSGVGTSDSILFKTGSQSTRHVIDTNGTLILGGATTSFSSGDTLELLGGTGTLAGANSVNFRLQSYNVSGNGSSFSLQYINNATTNAQGAVTILQTVGSFGFGGSDGTAVGNGARISGVAEATWTNGSRPMRLAFATCAASSTTLVEALRIDSNGNVQSLLTLGYGPASLSIGGAVTQLTSKATGVTLNNICGQITMNNAALAGNTTVTFVFTNDTIGATDVVNVAVGTVGASGTFYFAQANNVAAGSCTIVVRNTTATSGSDAVVLNYAVIKAVAN